MRQLLVIVRTGMHTPRFWVVLIVWGISLLYVLFQGGKTSLMLFAMISLLVVYLVAGGLVESDRQREAECFLRKKSMGNCCMPEIMSR